MRWLISLCAVVVLLQAGAEARAQTLRLSDDGTSRIYHVHLDGTLINSYPAPFSADSSVDLDPTTHTLWTTGENAAGGRFVNLSRRGELPPDCAACEPTLLATGIGISEPEGLGVDSDGTLWVVNDPNNVGGVFHLERDGTWISSFATADFDPASISPQAIAVDPFDGTLWLTDNESDRIYNVTRTGGLIASFPALDYTSVLDPGVTNPAPQGIDVDPSNGSLWVTDRATGRVYNITSGRDAAPAGQLLSSFSPVAFGSLNPTGVAYDAALPLPALPDAGLLGLALALLAAGRRTLHRGSAPAASSP